MAYTVQDALQNAIETARLSPCAKSKRGVVIFVPGDGDHAGVYARGFNSQPNGFHCDGSDRCKENCNKLCNHAEQVAIMNLGSNRVAWPDLLHVKVDDNGNVAVSGPPSCWQCSRLILAFGISGVWLLHEDGLKRYPADVFHQLTLEHCGIALDQRICGHCDTAHKKTEMVKIYSNEEYYYCRRCDEYIKNRTGQVSNG